MSREDGDGEPPEGPGPDAVPRTAEQIVAAGLRAGKPCRAIAADLFGARRVAAEWQADGPIRARVRRLADRVRRAAAGGPPRSPGSGVGGARK